MPMFSLLKAMRRVGSNRNDDVLLEANEENELFIANGSNAPYTEIVRRGGVWSLMSAASTPLVVIPTTSCNQEVFNNTTDSVLEILRLSLFHLLGTAALHNVSLWAEVTAPKVAPTLAALTIGSNSGREAYTNTVASPVITANGTTVAAAGWQPFGMPGPGVVSTALPGEAWSVAVDGILLVPPKCSLAIAAVDALATGSSVQVGCTFNIRKLTMA